MDYQVVLKVSPERAEIFTITGDEILAAVPLQIADANRLISKLELYEVPTNNFDCSNEDFLCSAETSKYFPL